MSVTPISFVRKPFHVSAVQVTHENLSEVAEWCQGAVDSEIKGSTQRRFVKVQVSRPLNVRQTQAFIGDWILKSEMGFKVYTQRAFETSFVEEQDAEAGVSTESLDDIPAITLTQVDTSTAQD